MNFIELPCFSRRWATLGLNDENDLAAVQIAIMSGPKTCPTIKGTGGIRKLRFAPARWNTGKSGAARVLYVYFEEYGMVLLCLVNGKSEVDNISDAVKQHLNVLVREAKAELRRRYAGKLK